MNLGIFPGQNMLSFPNEKNYMDNDSDPSMTYKEPERVMTLETVGDGEETWWDELEWSSKEEKKHLDLRKLFKPEIELDKRIDFWKLVSPMIDISALGFEDLETCIVQKLEISIKPNTTPIYLPPYRKSSAEREIIKQEVQKMLDAKVIEPCMSAWSSPCIMIPKKNGKKRFCVDYRQLNAVTIPTYWPIPHIDDLLAELAGSKYFSTLDLASGYWQIGIEESSKDMTAFSTQDGHWRFNKLPFGVKNGPFLFSKIIKELLGHLPFCQVYLDDIVIHSSTIESHIKHIRAIAKILEEAKLKINPEKCTWLATKIKFLGHVVSGDQISMDMEKINEIMKRAPPRNVKEVQQFLGSCNFYRKFITDFAKMTQPLTTLLKSDVKFDMNAERLEAFNTLK